MAWKGEEALLGLSDWLGISCMSGSASHAHTGCMRTRVSRLGRSDSWFFRAVVGVACGHSQLLQYLKLFNKAQGENTEFKMKGKPKPRRGQAAYAEMGKSFWSLVFPVPT